MKYFMAATLLALVNFASGCASWSENVLVGGERQVFFRAGTAVPPVRAEDNTEGYYLLTARELGAILNP